MPDVPAPLNYETAAPPPPKGALLTVLLIVFVDLLGFGIILPQLPFYGTHFHASDLQVALLFSVYSVCQFVAAPILGLMSDRFGRRPVLVLSQLGSAVGYVLLGVATDYHFANLAAGLAVLYLARIIDGLSGGNISTAQAYVSDVTTPANRAKGMGLLGAAFGVGFAVGPSIGGILAGRHAEHPSWPAYLAAAFSLTAAVLSATRLPESRQPGATTADEAWLHPSKFLPILRNRTIGQLLLISFAAMTAFTMLEGTIGLYVNRVFGFTAWGLGWYFAYVGVFIMLGQGYLMARLVKRHGEWAVTIAGSSLVTVGMVLYIVTGQHPLIGLLLLAGTVNALGRSLQQPPIQTLVSKLTDRRQQGTVFGLYHGLGSLARSLGPILAGLLLTRFALPMAYPFAVAGSIMAVVAGWLLQLRLAHAAPPAAVPVVPAEAAAEAVVETAQAPS